MLSGRASRSFEKVKRFFLALHQNKKIEKDRMRQKYRNHKDFLQKYRICIFRKQL